MARVPRRAGFGVTRKAPQLASARADHELSDPARGVLRPPRIERNEPLVVVLVAEAIRGTVDPETVTHDNPSGLYAITRDNADDPETAPWIYPADLSSCPDKPLG